MRFELSSKELPLGVYVEQLIAMGYKVKQDVELTSKWLYLDKTKDIVAIRKKLDREITISESVITGHPLLIIH